MRLFRLAPGEHLRMRVWWRGFRLSLIVGPMEGVEDVFMLPEELVPPSATSFRALLFGCPIVKHPRGWSRPRTVCW